MKRHDARETAAEGERDRARNLARDSAKELARDMEPDMAPDLERALRFAADRLCLWRLCHAAACRRARACRGDGCGCARLVVGWLAAIEAEARARPDAAALDAGIETPADLRAYRAWLRALGG